MSNLENERAMWASIVETTRAAEDPTGLVTTQMVTLRNGSQAVLLTHGMVKASADDGRVALPDGTVVTWYTLGRTFVRRGTQMCYGYLRYDAKVSAERARRREQHAWNESHR